MAQEHTTVGVGAAYTQTSPELSLLGTLTRVEVPFVKVTIGKYTFGVYDKTTGTYTSATEAYRVNSVKYPNYVKSLSIIKINGQVNQYTLVIDYPITQFNDPNFFEKVFSSVSQSRKIVFSYGDLSMPTFIYKDEEAIITEVSTSFRATSSVISYTIKAISSAALLQAGSYTFQARRAKPSTVIRELLSSDYYGLKEIFYGMRDLSLVDSKGLLATDDAEVELMLKTNISVLDYLSYLVSSMTPVSDSKSSLSKSGLYVLNIVDDTTGVFQGPYFTIRKLQGGISGDMLGTYYLDMGYPSNNIVTDFSINNNETYSIYYDYTKELNDQTYQYRINDQGKMEPVYAPTVSSNNSLFQTTEADRSWWTSVTSYPVSATLSMKGLIRPALLMSYIRLNMLYYGKKHISSGLYVVTQQVDTIDERGYRTTLSLVRISGDDSMDGYVSNINYGSYASSNNANNNNINSGYRSPNTGVG